MAFIGNVVLLSFGIAVAMASNNTAEPKFIPRNQANEGRVVTIEFNTGGTNLTPEQYRRLRNIILEGIRRRRATTVATTVTTEEMTAAATTTTPTTITTEAATTAATTTRLISPDPQRRKRHALFSDNGDEFNDDDISFINLPNPSSHDGIIRISEVLDTDDSRITRDLLVDTLRELNNTGELKKAVGASMVNIYLGLGPEEESRKQLLEDTHVPLNFEDSWQKQDDSSAMKTLRDPDLRPYHIPEIVQSEITMTNPKPTETPYFGLFRGANLKWTVAILVGITIVPCAALIVHLLANMRDAEKRRLGFSKLSYKQIIQA